MSSLRIPFPTELRPILPTIVGNVDYLTLRRRLEQIESLLRASGLEADFVEQALRGWRQPGPRRPTARQQQQFQLRSRRALRCTILRTLLQEDYGGLAAPWRAIPSISGSVWWTRWTRCGCPPRVSCNVSPTGWTRPRCAR